MQLKLTVVLLVLSTLTSFAQHPWESPLRSTASDAAAELRLTRSDSVCVNLAREPFTDQAPDSISQAVLDLFARLLTDKAQGAAVSTGCTNGSAAIELRIAQPEGMRYRFASSGQHLANERSWAAVFFLPEVGELPEESRLSNDFNLDGFSLPALPAAVTVTRMSGAQITGTLVSAEGIDLVIDIPRGKTEKNKKPKRLNLHKSEVFSVQFPEGEWVLYAPDRLLGDDITADEMRIFIAAQRDARENFKVWPTVVTGVVVCGAVAVLASGGLFLTILPPLAYAGVQFIPVIRIRENTISNPSYRYNEVYAEGYGRVARSRKVLGGLKGGAIGMVLGTAAYFIFLQ
ncbi:MAG: hypothetical protein ACFCUH_06335 [Flavobacteriales bacterium]